MNGADTVLTVGDNSISNNVYEAGLTGAVFNDANVVFQNSWNLTWDPTPDPTSIEIINGGNDASDIGVSGGSIPYNVTGTPLPYIRQFIVPSVVRQGDNLPVEIRAVGN